MNNLIFNFCFPARPHPIFRDHFTPTSETAARPKLCERARKQSDRPNTAQPSPKPSPAQAKLVKVDAQIKVKVQVKGRAKAQVKVGTGDIGVARPHPIWRWTKN